MRNFRWRLLQRRGGRRTQEAGESLFHGLRVRLTFWYCGVLCAALVIFGVALYFGTQIALVQPIENDVRANAWQHAQQWGGPRNQPCPLIYSDDSPAFAPDTHGFAPPAMVLCFDASGNLLANQGTASLPAAFLNKSLVQQALQASNGCADDTVDAGGTSGFVYRYAVVASTPGGRVQGVIMVGESVQPQYNALSTLLMLLLSIGAGALLCACLGGLFLANRALAPARLAWANQQRFIADASHELRTPLTLLRADADVLLRGRERLGEGDADLLEDIVAETNHMAKITTDLLTLARLDSHLAHRDHEVVNFTQLAKGMVRRVQALASQRGLRLSEEHTGEAYVIGDVTLLEQAILVLLDNAIKYNRPAGQITVRTAIQNGRVLLRVQDSGIGITAEHLPNLGERFYRVDKARSRAVGGTGLGLSIARSIATTHGGQLNLASQPGQGTTAIFELPLAQLTRASQSSADQHNSAIASITAEEKG